jgi:predicted amidohydrolase
LPTNWPEGSEFTPEHTIPTRAKENCIFYVAVNRVGEEGGYTFFGHSKIVDCLGVTLAEGRSHKEDFLYAEIEPTMAREKYVVKRPGEYEVHRLNDRRPEFYGQIVKPLVDPSRIRE